MLTQHRARIRKHNQNRIEPQQPEHRNHSDAGDAARLEHGLAQRGTAAGGDAVGGGGRVAVAADRDGFLAGQRARRGRCDHVDFGDVDFRVGEAGGVFDGGAAEDGVLLVGAAGPDVVREHEEPADAEERGEDAVDEAVEEDQVGEGQTLERGLFPDVWDEDGEEDEGADGVDVHGELQARERISCEDREDAIESGDFV